MYHCQREERATNQFVFKFQPIVLSGFFRATTIHRYVSIALLATFAAGLTGLPFNPATSPKEGRFPCENCPCGCSTAEYCWDKCCCHSDLEKLDWASRNGVTPPASLIARVSLSKATVVVASRCSASEKTSCCCGSTHAAAPGSTDPTKEKADTTSSRIVRLEDAAKCRGLQWVWTTLSTAILDRPIGAVASSYPPLLYCMTVTDALAESRFDAPEPPVPWRFSS